MAERDAAGEEREKNETEEDPPAAERGQDLRRIGTPLHQGRTISAAEAGGK